MPERRKATPTSTSASPASATAPLASPAAPDTSSRPKRRGRPANPNPPALSQINARIDADLKDQGDAALERAGFSPTTAVRALWQLAVRLDNQPGALAAILDPDRDKPTDEELAERARKVKLAQQGAQIVPDLLGEMGITIEDMARAMAGFSDDDLRELAYEEHLKEREARA